MPHARASASGMSRWGRCPGSLALCESLQLTSPDTVYTLRGTAGHKVAQVLFVGGPYVVKAGQVYVPSRDTIVDRQYAEDAGLLHEAVVITEQLIEWAAGYVAYVRSFHPQVLQIEVPLDASRWVPEGYGTCDALWVTVEDSVTTLHVADYKTGVTPVAVRDNEQALYYAAAAYDLMHLLFDIDHITLHIYQPTLETPASRHTYTVAEVLQWADTRLAPAAAATLAPDAPLVPGEIQCRWCPAKSHCPAIARANLTRAFGEFAAFESLPAAPIESRTLTDDDVGLILAKLPLMEGWIKALRERAFDTLRRNGNDGVPGWKLVAGRALRRWVDPDSAARQLAALGYSPDQIYTQAIVSPAGAERLVATEHRDQLKALITKPPGKPTLAPVTDSRAPLALTTAYDDFNDVLEN